MGTATLIRPDGSKVLVPDTDVEKLRTLGYREQSEGEALSEAISRGYEEHYTTPGQRVITGLEGLASGLTLGASDLLLDSESAKDRARYNPGIRLGTELIGGIGPALVPGGTLVGGALRYTPAGALARGATRAGEAAQTLGRGSKVVNSMVRGTVEGAGVGAGAAITNAQLTGDPITAESIMAGMGWGAVWGGGLSALGAGLESRFEARAASKAAAEADLLARPSKAEVFAGEEFERARGKAAVHQEIQDALKDRHIQAKALEESNYAWVREAVVDANVEIKEAVRAVEDAALDFKKLGYHRGKVYNRVINDPESFQMTRREVNSFQRHFERAQVAAKGGKYEEMITHLESFNKNLVGVEIKLAPFSMAGERGFTEAAAKASQELIGLGKLRVEAATRAAEETAQLNALKETLSKFPRTPDEFLKLKTKTLEDLTGAVDQLGKLRPAEMAGVQEAVKNAVSKFTGSMGVVIEGSPGAQLQGLHRIMKEARSKRGREMSAGLAEGRRNWEKSSKAEDRLFRARMERETAQTEERTGGRGHVPWLARYAAGSWVSSKMGGGPVGYALGAGLVSGLVNLKGAILGTISDKATKWLPRVGRGLQRVGPRLEPLNRRLDGTEDETGRREELMRRRAREITQAAPVVRDTLYRAVQPLAIAHPELALGLHKHGVQRFQYLLSVLPKDPGLAYSNLKSLWKPDSVAVERFARAYEVFQDPVGVVVRAIEKGKTTREHVDALKNMNPELYSYFRAAMLYRLAEPEVHSKMKYSDQVEMGLLLDIDLHSTMNPKFIAAQQQMFTERNQPLEMNPRIQPGGGAGRPAGPGPSATASQRITEH